ncbi:MAG: alpha/beta hydrolase [Hyphomicrobiaceae bacterium]
MPHAVSNGVKIYFEETGPVTAPAILFCHEFGGDFRSWEDQMRYLGRNWRCITFSNRGYPQSDAPADEAAYGQDIANRDAIAVLDHLKIAKAHVVGLSMGGYTTLMLAAKFPDRVLSCVAAGAGSGALKTSREQFIAEARQAAAEMDKKGVVDAIGVGLGPTRVQLQNKDPRGWQQFVAHLGEHAAHAAANTLRQVQAKRASLYDIEAELKGIAAPTLLLVGDEDEPCLDVNLWLKRLIATSRLGILPAAGHAINLEEPALFNSLVEQFLTGVDRGTWQPRDARAVPGQAVGSLGVKRQG